MRFKNNIYIGFYKSSLLLATLGIFALPLNNLVQPESVRAMQGFGCPDMNFLYQEYSNWTIEELQHRLYGDPTGYNPTHRQRVEGLYYNQFSTASDYRQIECISDEIALIQQLIRKKNQESRRTQPFIPRRECNSVEEYDPFNQYGCTFFPNRDNPYY